MQRGAKDHRGELQPLANRHRGQLLAKQVQLVVVGIAGTLATRLQWVDTVVEAALEGSREKFVQALLIDGVVKSVDVAYRLGDDLLQAQAEYLPQFRASAR